MGTSSSHTSPTGGGWTKAKTSMTRFARSGGSSEIDTNSVTSSYVDALGGARSIVRSAVTGRSVAQNLGRFLADIATVGVERTFTERGIRNLIGLETEAVLYGLVDNICPFSNTIEESIARSALEQVFENILEECDWDINLLGQIVDRLKLIELLEQFIEFYIFDRILNELGDRLDRGDITSKDAKNIEEDLKGYIQETIKLEFTKNDPLAIDWRGEEGERIIRDLFQDAYEQIS